MLTNDSIKSIMLAEIFKEKIENKGITLTEISKKMNVKQPSLSRVLNGRTLGTDKYFQRIGKAIGLTDTRIKEIFKKTDKKHFLYKYGEELSQEKTFSYEELFSIMKEKESLSDEQMNAIQDYINLQKLKGTQ